MCLILKIIPLPPSKGEAGASELEGNNHSGLANSKIILDFPSLKNERVELAGASEFKPLKVFYQSNIPWINDFQSTNNAEIRNIACNERHAINYSRCGNNGIGQFGSIGFTDIYSL